MKPINPKWRELANRTSVQTQDTELSPSRIETAIAGKGLNPSTFPPEFLNAVYAAAQHACIFQNGLPDKYVKAGPPADNSRVILAHDIRLAAKAVSN